jgi:hypothetical protein
LPRRFRFLFEEEPFGHPRIIKVHHAVKVVFEITTRLVPVFHVCPVRLGLARLGAIRCPIRRFSGMKVWSRWAAWLSCFFVTDMPRLEMLHDEFAVVVNGVIVDLVDDIYQIVYISELLHTALPDRLHELVLI